MDQMVLEASPSVQMKCTPDQAYWLQKRLEHVYVLEPMGRIRTAPHHSCNSVILGSWVGQELTEQPNTWLIYSSCAWCIWYYMWRE